jgi:hypothetical protein
VQPRNGWWPVSLRTSGLSSRAIPYSSALHASGSSAAWSAYRLDARRSLPRPSGPHCPAPVLLTAIVARAPGQGPGPYRYWHERRNLQGRIYCTQGGVVGDGVYLLPCLSYLSLTWAYYAFQYPPAARCS